MKIIKYISIIGIVISAASTIYASRGNTDSNLLINVLFTMWAIAPFVAIFILNKYVLNLKVLKEILLTSIVCLGLNYYYFDSLFVHPDAQSALTFLFVPLYQFLATFVGLITGKIWSILTKN